MAGRPTKYRPEMCEQVKAALAKGYSQAACAGMLGIAVDTFIEWKKERSEFSDAVKEGESLSRLWWEDRGRDACSDPKSGLFNARTWELNMKNRFGWRDKNEVTGDALEPIIVNVFEKTLDE